MPKETGLAFLFATAAVFAVWHMSRRAGVSVAAGPVTTNAGMITPAVALSPLPDDGNDWSNVPFYLRVNYPANRDLGSGVAPSVVDWSLPRYYGAQQVPPSL